MRDVVVEDGDILTLNVLGSRELRESQPEIYAAMMDCAAWVNSRRIEVGERPILAISCR